MKTRARLKSLSHSVFKLTYHIVFVTKYRKPVMTPIILEDMKQIISRVCTGWGCSLIECNGETDHLHMLIESHPNLILSTLINNLKTVSSKLIRMKHKTHIARFYWKPLFWHGSYCIVSTGGAPLDIVKAYIKNQTSA
ncbi:MAG: IS200/IS605 family transposase [Nitrospirae bacterium]|nr:IS200/IS605 family transposase [Nitrospirota bacterium]